MLAALYALDRGTVVHPLAEPPRADTGRYDSLRLSDSGEEIDHA